MDDCCQASILSKSRCLFRFLSEKLRTQVEYDLAESLKVVVRGKYAELYRAGVNLVRMEADVARAFPTEAAVNKALRLVMKMAELPTKEPH
jgi:hypothetical protein